MLPTGYGTLDLLPTAIELAGAEIELVGMDDRETLLQHARWSRCARSYDYISDRLPAVAEPVDHRTRSQLRTAC